MVLMLTLVAGCMPGCGYPWFPRTKVDPAGVSNERLSETPTPGLDATSRTTIEISPPSAADPKTPIEPATLPESGEGPPPLARPSPHPVYVETQTEIKFGEKSIKAPPGSTVKVQFNEAERKPTTVAKRTDRAVGTGSGYSSATEGVKADTTAPNVSLTSEGGMMSTGGTFDFSAKALAKGPTVLYVVGGIAILVGLVIAIALKQYVWGGALAGGGLVLIGVAVLFESYPWVVFIGLAAVIGVAVWYVLRVRGNAQAGATLQTVIQAVEAAPAAAAATVKNAIAAYASHKGLADTVKAVITKAKKKLGLNQPPLPVVTASPNAPPPTTPATPSAP
jgi:hypothetical protein